MELRDKILAVVRDTVDDWECDLPGEMALAITAAILTIPEIRGAEATAALLEGERKIFENYRADLGRLLNRN